MNFLPSIVIFGSAPIGVPRSAGDLDLFVSEDVYEALDALGFGELEKSKGVKKLVLGPSIEVWKTFPWLSSMMY